MTLVRINNGAVDLGNSTETPLQPGETFQGTGTDVVGWGTATVMLFSDVAGEPEGFLVEFSTDNVHWDDPYPFSIAGSTPRRFQFPITARYFRLAYKNGDRVQSEFRLQTLLHRTDVDTSIHRAGDPITQDRSATLVKSALMAQATDGGFVPLQIDADGALEVVSSADNTPLLQEILAALNRIEQLLEQVRDDDD